MFHTLDLIRITPAGWLAGAPPLSCSCNCNLRRQSCRGRIRDGPHRPLRTTRKPPHPRKSTQNTPLFESSVLRCGVFQADAKKAAEVRESRRREEGGLPRPRWNQGVSCLKVRLPVGSQVGAGRANLLWSSTTQTRDKVRHYLSCRSYFRNNTTLCFGFQQ